MNIMPIGFVRLADRIILERNGQTVCPKRPITHVCEDFLGCQLVGYRVTAIVLNAFQNHGGLLRS